MILLVEPNADREWIDGRDVNPALLHFMMVDNPGRNEVTESGSCKIVGRPVLILIYSRYECEGDRYIGQCF